MLVDMEGSWELLRSVSVPLCVLFSVIFLGAGVGPVGAVHDFTGYRMQHFDLHGVHYGSRSAVVNMEVRSEGAVVLNRKCVVVRWRGLTLERVRDLLKRGAGSLLILLPREWAGLEEEELQTWMELEEELMAEDVPVPVYLAWEDDQLLEVYSQAVRLAELERNSSVAATLVTMVTQYGYQMVSDAVKEPQPVKDASITSIMGKLIGQGLEHQLPTVAIVAHYDAFGLASYLSFGYDSNASGVAALLELARLLSRLYSDPKQRPKYNLVFVLTGGGKLNYFGTKAFLEEQLEDDTSLLADADYTFCLDTLATANSSLLIHVSKPPRQGGTAYQLLQALNRSAVMADLQVSLVHKKIRLSEDLLSWEHERFSLKRLPAGTLSALPTHHDQRRSMFAHRSQTDISILTRNIRIIAEAVARHAYNLSGDSADYEVFPESQSVHTDYVRSWLDLMSATPRSPQILGKDHQMVTGLQQAMARYLQDVAAFTHQPDKGDPEFVVYDVPISTLRAYRVKPAIFDLFLALTIACYLSLWYLVIAYYHRLSPQLLSLQSLIKIKTE